MKITTLTYFCYFAQSAAFLTEVDDYSTPTLIWSASACIRGRLIEETEGGFCLPSELP